MNPDDLPPASNPFSAHRIRPGAIPYHFPPGHTAEGLLARLEQSGWQGQIVGPHGTGKSTLLAALRPLIERRGKATLLYELHDRQRYLPVKAGQEELTGGSLLIVDGYEQLSLWSRIRLRRLCRRRRLGLLVTTHRPAALPVLFRTQSSCQLALRLARELLRGEAEGDEVIAVDEVSRLFAEHQGNLREVLFGLYDLYELNRQRRSR